MQLTIRRTALNGCRQIAPSGSQRIFPVDRLASILAAQQTCSRTDVWHHTAAAAAAAADR